MSKPLNARLEIENLEERLVLTTPAIPNIVLPDEARIEALTSETTVSDSDFSFDPLLEQIQRDLKNPDATFVIVPNLPNGREFVDEVPSALGKNVQISNLDLRNPILRGLLAGLAGGQEKLNDLLEVGDGLQLRVVESSILRDPFLFSLVDRLATDDVTAQDFLSAGEGLFLLNFEAQIANPTTLKGVVIGQLQQRIVNNLETVLRQEAVTNNAIRQVSLPLEKEIQKRIADIHEKRLDLILNNSDRLSFRYLSFRSGTDFQGRRILPSFREVPQDLLERLASEGKDLQSLFKLEIKVSVLEGEDEQDSIYRDLKSELAKFDKLEAILQERLDNLPETGASPVFQLRSGLFEGSGFTKDVHFANGFIYVVDLTKDLEAQKRLPIDPEIEKQIKGAIQELDATLSTADFEHFITSLQLTPVEEALLIEQDIRALVVEGERDGFTPELEERIDQLEERFVELYPLLPSKEEFLNDKASHAATVQRLVNEGRLDRSVLDQPQEGLGAKAIRTFFTGVATGATLPLRVAKDINNLVGAVFGTPKLAEPVFNGLLNAGNEAAKFLGLGDGGTALAKFRNEEGFLQSLTETIDKKKKLSDDLNKGVGLKPSLIDQAFNQIDIVASSVAEELRPVSDKVGQDLDKAEDVIQIAESLGDDLSAVDRFFIRADTLGNSLVETGGKLIDAIGQQLGEALDKAKEGDLEAPARFGTELAIEFAVEAVAAPAKAAKTATALVDAVDLGSDVGRTAKKVDASDANLDTLFSSSGTGGESFRRPTVRLDPSEIGANQSLRKPTQILETIPQTPSRLLDSGDSGLNLNLLSSSSSDSTFERAAQRINAFDQAGSLSDRAIRKLSFEERQSIIQSLVQAVKRSDSPVLTPAEEFTLTKLTVRQIEDVIQKNRKELLKATADKSLKERLTDQSLDGKHLKEVQSILDQDPILREAQDLSKIRPLGGEVGFVRPYSLEELGRPASFFSKFIKYDAVKANFAIPGRFAKLSIPYIDTAVHEGAHYLITKFLGEFRDRTLAYKGLTGVARQDAYLEAAKARYLEEAFTYTVGRLATGVRAKAAIVERTGAIKSLKPILDKLTPDQKTELIEYGYQVEKRKNAIFKAARQKLFKAGETGAGVVGAGGLGYFLHSQGGQSPDASQP